jgi:hypothetical protein
MIGRNLLPQMQDSPFPFARFMANGGGRCDTLPAVSQVPKWTEDRLMTVEAFFAAFDLDKIERVRFDIDDIEALGALLARIGHVIEGEEEGHFILKTDTPDGYAVVDITIWMLVKQKGEAVYRSGFMDHEPFGMMLTLGSWHALGRAAVTNFTIPAGTDIEDLSIEEFVDITEPHDEYFWPTEEEDTPLTVSAATSIEEIEEVTLALLNLIPDAVKAEKPMIVYTSDTNESGEDCLRFETSKSYEEDWPSPDFETIAQFILNVGQFNGSRWEYNDGHSSRKSGYSLDNEMLCVALEESSSSATMNLARKAAAAKQRTKDIETIRRFLDKHDAKEAPRAALDAIAAPASQDIAA